MEPKSKFIKSETLGRDLLNNFLNNYFNSSNISNITFTTLSEKLDSYCNYSNSDSTYKLGFEVKVRDSKYYECEEFIMEKSKYDYMCYKKWIGDIKFAYYCCFFDFNTTFGNRKVLYLYEENDISNYGRIDTIKCKDSTVNFKRYIDKVCIMLPKDKGTRFIYNQDNNIWNIQ